MENLSLDTLPSSIHFEEDRPFEQKAGWGWRYLQYPLEKIGKSLRDSLYLPLYNKKVEQASRLELELATEVAHALKNQEAPLHFYKKLETIRDHFSIRDVAVHIHGETTRVFIVRIFESKTPIQGKNLRIILFSFYGNTEGPTGTERRWEPLTMKMLSQAPLDVLKALKKSGIAVDSLFTTSLGNITYDGLKHLSPTDQDIIPSTLIINRGLTSIKKVAYQLFSFPLNFILYRAARLSGWDANPEQDMLDFLAKSPRNGNGAPRRIMLIEALKDHYYSGPGSFETDLHEKIAQLGVSVFRAIFYPFVFHEHAHHSLSLSKLTKNSATVISANTFPLNFATGEKISTVIARDIFLETDHHTCFYVGGNGTTPDTGTLAVISLLYAYIKEAEKKELNI